MLLFENKTLFIYFIISIDGLNCLWCNIENSHRFSILIKKIVNTSSTFLSGAQLHIKKKSQTGLLRPIIYKSTYTLDKTCIKKSNNLFAEKKGEILYFILNVKFKVFCVNLRQNIGIYTSSGCSLCISCVICPHPNIRQFSDHGIRP